MDEVIGEYGSLIVEIISATFLIGIAMNKLWPAFHSWVELFVNTVLL